MPMQKQRKRSASAPGLIGSSTVTDSSAKAPYLSPSLFYHAEGEPYRTILRYFAPEYITTIVLYSLLSLLDAWWIAELNSTSAYATSGMTNILFHLLIKMAEGFSVGTTVMVGHYNGIDQKYKVGRTITDAFWLSLILGGAISCALYFGASLIWYFYGVPAKMIRIGIPYLQLRTLSIFFMFVYFGFVGFLRGIKKPKVPMVIYVVGAVIFLFCDYALIFGAFGFPELKLQGSALASVIQYAFMLLAVVVYVFAWPKNRQYGVHLLMHSFDVQRIKDLMRLSWPVMLDKSLLAFSYIWLGRLIGPMGTHALASYTVIKDLERFAIMPAAALAQVITYLVSNAYATGDWVGIKATVKKTLLLAGLFVFVSLVIFSLWPSYFIGFFDHKSKFTSFAAGIFPFVSVLAFFDLLQLILSGALRGAANVQMVMYVRLAVGLLYFIPVSYALSRLSIEDMQLKFLLVYCAFYLGNGLMAVVYIARFKGNRWQRKSVESGGSCK